MRFIINKNFIFLKVSFKVFAVQNIFSTEVIDFDAALAQSEIRTIVAQSRIAGLRVMLETGITSLDGEWAATIGKNFNST